MSTLLLIAAAYASSTYPAEVEAELGMPCAPQCTLCHETNAGGGGTVTREFGGAMMDRGLAGGAQSDLLIAALDAMTADAVDSDGDGVTDIDALLAGEDPNGGTAFCDVLAPTYGCLNHTPTAMSAFGVLAAVVGLRRRRA